ncbi:hypothetical protein T10_2509 [Trichinella papuae]|uniref:Uncharacterized protein n=1 Tax=Trichinella papuae TaxID=268474 RepID=A0A0V1M4A4_9BILA|nr:hypothetical protein T10_2509 [Trichinella papuae]
MIIVIKQRNILRNGHFLTIYCSTLQSGERKGGAANRRLVYGSTGSAIPDWSTSPDMSGNAEYPLSC